MSVEVRSFAKVNLHLEVLHRRSDGFHEIRSILQLVSLADTLVLTARAPGAAIEVACDAPGVPLDRRNLAYRAAEMILRRAGDARGVHVRIAKRIPVGGGLGGGSSNAAATLLAVDRLYGLGVRPAALHEMATELGSDVPFFLLPGGTAFAGGRGEMLEPLPPLPRRWLVVATPPFGVETAWAYAQLEPASRDERSAREVAALFAAGDVDRALAACSNRLAEPVLARYPEIARLEARLGDLGATHALMSGSGSSVFGVFRDEAVAAEAARAVSASGSFATVCTTQERRDEPRSCET